jgi:Helix-turn-helix domain
MRSEPKRIPHSLIARVAHWAMQQRRLGVTVSDEVVGLLVVLADRFNYEKGVAYPGNKTLCRDLGLKTKDSVSARLKAAEKLGAIIVKVGRGRGHATEVRFTDAVWTAPNLPTFKFMDRQDDTQKDEPARPFVETGEAERASPAGEKGESGRSKRTSPLAPYRSSTAIEPLMRPSAAPISATEGTTTDNGNGALTDVAGERPWSEECPSVYVPPERKPDPPPRVEQFRQALRGSGRYVPLTEDAEAARRAVLAEQAAVLRGAGGSV